MPKKTKTPEQPKASKETDKLSKYLDDFQTAYDYVRTNYHNLWRDCYRLYRNKRVKIGYEGYSDAFIPETHTIIESLVANIAGGRPKFEFLATFEEQEQNTDVLNQLMDYIWDANSMNIKSQIWVREMLQYGTGVLFVGWNVDKDIPSVMNIPIYNFFFDPTATGRDTARYMGFRYLADKEALKKAKTVDPETGELKPMYDLSALENVEGGATDGEQMDKEMKDLISGSTVPLKAEENQIEMICIYYKDGRKVEIANRATIAFDGKSPYQQPERTAVRDVDVNGMLVQEERTIPEVKPFFPFAVLRDYVDPSLFLGTGEIEVIKDRQETLNDVENMDLDNAAYANNIMWQIDPLFADLMPEITAAPGLVVPIPKGALQPIDRPMTTADLDNMKLEIRDQMRRATAADEIVQGVSQDKGRITATEVSSQLSQAQTRFSTKINNLESEGYAQLAEILLKTCQIFLTQETAIRIVGDAGTEWKDYDPVEFSGDYEPHVKLESTIDQMKLEEGQKLNQMYQLLLGNPFINQPEALRFIFKNLGAEKEDIDKLIAQPQMPGMPPTGAVDPAMAAMGGQGDMNGLASVL